MKNKENAIERYRNHEWNEAKIYAFKGFKFRVFKSCRIYFPLWSVYLGNVRFGYRIFHNGYGFYLHSPLVSINICTSGKIGWWYDKGLFSIRIGEKKWEY